MKYSLIGAFAILIASAFVLSTASAGPIAQLFGPDSHTDDAVTIDDDHEMADEADNADETEMSDSLLAGGGGWRSVIMNAKAHKITFGVSIDGNDGNWSNSSFVFQARDQGVTIHAMNFTDIVFDNNADGTFVHAWGWAKYDKKEGFWFHLVLKDNGMKADDKFELSIYKDINTNWAMDETSVLLHWVFNGLGGGNIWVG